MSKEKPIELEKERYWIKTGIPVMHIDYPEIKMRVQTIRKINKKVNDGNGNMVERTFIIGVNVTWVNADNKFEKGMFTTRELKPWPEDKPKKAPAKKK